MNIIKIALSVLIMLLIISCQTTKPKKSESYPSQVENLIIPSGLDNDYVLSIMEKKTVNFRKPVIRISEFQLSDSFIRAINNTDLKAEEKLKSEIARTGRFELLGTDDDIKVVLEEQRKASMDEFDSTDGPEPGYLKLAGYTLTGKITQSIPVVKQEGGYFSLKVSVGVSLTLTNATTGEIAFTENITAENEEKLFVSAEGMIIKGPRNLTDKPINSINASGSDIDLVPQYIKALDEAINKTVYTLEEKNPVMGEILAVEDKIITTTASDSHGIKTGDYLFILKTGKPLKDSSGKLLGFKKTIIGAAKVISAEKNMSQAEVIKLNNEELLPEERNIVISLPASALK